MAPALIPEAHIEVFATQLVHPYERSQPRYLIPSPEVYLKRLVADGWGSVFSIGRCFRNAESSSRLHNPEFTMLEWYTVDADYRDSIALTTELLGDLAASRTAPLGERGGAAGATRVGAPPVRITVRDAFVRYAGCDPDVFEAPGALRDAADRHGMRVGDDESDEDLFQRILLSHVEPNLPTDRPLFLCDYPTLVPTLAARSPDGAFAERWELYINGVEIANCYTEERDQGRLARFTAEQSDAKQSALVPHAASDTLARFGG
ncbi:MAG: hypothetical protein EA382_04150, partial [Spirochaetaceae bacterium]